MLTAAPTTVLAWPKAILLPDTEAVIPAPWPITVELLLAPSLAPLPTTVEFAPPAVAELPSAVVLAADALAP